MNRYTPVLPTLVFALAAGEASANSTFCPKPDLKINSVSPSVNADGSVQVKMEVKNVGTSCSDSTMVAVYAMKSGDWGSCDVAPDSMIKLTAGLPLIAAGGTRVVSVTVPAAYWSSTRDDSIFGYLDNGDLLTENDEINNRFVLALKPKQAGGAKVTSIFTDLFDSPGCVLDDLAPVFSDEDAEIKLWVKGEIL